MYSLKHNPILKDYQIKILKLFFDSSFAKPFFLTGGTALSAFYYAHRESKDFDFFSLEKFNPFQLKDTMDKIAKEVGAGVKVKIASDTYQELYLENKLQKWIQRIDIVHEQPRHFGQIVNIDGVRVDSLENIATNKILALFGRLEPKDYIDFYIIIKESNFKFDELFETAKQKDSGLFEFYFASSIANVGEIQSWPPLKIKIDTNKVVRFYENLSKKLLLKIQPREKML